MEFTLDDLLDELNCALEAMRDATVCGARTRLQDSVNWVNAIINEQKGGPYERELYRFYTEWIEREYGT